MATHQPGHGYDSFVVRLWHRSADGPVLRAELEHVQSGTVEVVVGVTWDDIRDWLRARLDAGPPPARILREPRAR